MDINIKEVNLSVKGHLMAVGIKDKGRIIDLPIHQLRHGACHQPEPRFPGGLGHGGMDASSRLLYVGAEGGVGVRTAEHLRKDRKLCSICCGALHFFGCTR